MNDRVRAMACLIVLVASIWVGLREGSSPEPLDAKAPAEVFSAGRAIRHLKAIARAPHATGQPEHALVRNYIVKELQDAGAETLVQETVASLARPGSVRAIGVRNITARIHGADGAPAVLLACHYDSTPGGPGAGDDGHAVAALLETVRALKAGPTMRRDLIFLFSDAEEAGLFGATAFVKQHPWKDQAGLVFNFDARGSSGPTLMYETSKSNGGLVREVALSQADLRASSASVAVYRRMRADTDFTRFKDAGYPGLNFALVGDAIGYHTELDDPAHLSMGSLQHTGATALALARHFGNLRAIPGPAADTVFFSAAGAGFVRYSPALAIPLAGCLAAAFLAVIGILVRRGSIAWTAIPLAAATWIAVAAAAGVVTYIFWRIGEFFVRAYRTPLSDVYGSSWLHAGFVLFALAAALASLPRLRRKFSVAELGLGIALPWVALAIVSAVIAPTASYLFLWPAAFALAGLAFGPVAALAVIPVIPFCSFALQAFRPDMAPAVVVALVLLFGLLSPLYETVWRVWRWQIPATASIAAAACIAWALWNSGFSSERPAPSNLSFGFDGAAGESCWASRDETTNAHTSPYLGKTPTVRTLPELFPGVSQKWLTAPTREGSLPVPSLEVLEFRRDGESSAARLRIRSARMAPILLVRFEEGVRLRRFNVEGHTLYDSPAEQYDRGWVIAMTGLNAGGANVDVQLLSAPGPLRVHLSDRSYGTSATGRPSGYMASPRWPDYTIAAMTYELR